MSLNRHTLLHEDLKRFFDAFPKDAHPMGILSAAMAALSTFYQDGDTEDPKAVELDIYRLLAKLPTAAAFAYKKSQGQPFIYPDNSLRYPANFLRMMFSFPTEEWLADDDICNALDALLILHADHEQNCSTSAVRLVGSGHAPLYACVSAGISVVGRTSWRRQPGGAGNARGGPARRRRRQEGGREGQRQERSVPSYGFRSPGVPDFDPRARILKSKADLVLDKLGIHDPLLEIAKELEEVALADPYFVERRLYPNVDFYSGIIYRALGIPTDMMTVMFAMGRLPGWIAHWKEMREQGQPIGRPRQIYTGPNHRAFIPLNER